MLDLHNLLRWAVLIVGVVAIVMAWGGVFTRSTWTKQQVTVGRIFTIVFDLQVLVGILLYAFFSDITTGAFNNFSGAMQSPQTRFFLVEHGLVMIVAAVLVHIGASRGRKTNSPLQPAIFYTLALVATLAAIPWDRSLIPGM